jgi:hypothetical protein
LDNGWHNWFKWGPVSTFESQDELGTIPLQCTHGASWNVFLSMLDTVASDLLQLLAITALISEPWARNCVRHQILQHRRSPVQTGDCAHLYTLELSEC